MRANWKVDFLVVGTQKGGTTALATFLSQHPEIFVPTTKEAHFFDFTRAYLDPSTGLPRYHSYHQLFEESQPHQLWGEVTPSYMFLQIVAERIYAYNPAAKLIFVLRDPVERALSHYRMECLRGRERWPFALAIALELVRVRVFSRDPDDSRDPIRIHTYLSRGFYSKQISRFLALFPKQNCMFTTSEELSKNHDTCLRSIFTFLGVNAEFNIPASHVFVGPEGRVSPVTKRILRLIYRYDRKRLERVTGLRLSDWG